MIRGAIFDVDGTLLQSMEFWDRAPQLYLKRTRTARGGRTRGPPLFDDDGAERTIPEGAVPSARLDTKDYL